MVYQALVSMTLNTNCYKSHVREHTVEPLLKEILTSLLCWGQQGPWCWVGEQHPSKNMFLVRGGCLLPATVSLVKGDENRWESSAGFQIHALNRKLWRENEQWCLQGVRHKKPSSAQFVRICVCMSGKMVAEVITCQWFSMAISLKFPLLMSSLPLHHPVIPGSQRWVLRAKKLMGLYISVHCFPWSDNLFAKINSS